MRGLALLTSLAIVAVTCGSTAAAPSASPVRLQTAVRTVAPTPTPAPAAPCPPAPSQPMPKATIVLEKSGTIVIALRPDKAPKTVATFTTKANKGFYDGLAFHRVVPGFVIQGGDPKGDGTGGGDQATELSDLCFTKGAVGIARGGNVQISNDSQFYICIGECRFLDGQYTNFGSVISGQDIADAVRVGDKIKTIRVE